MESSQKKTNPVVSIAAVCVVVVIAASLLSWFLGVGPAATLKAKFYASEIANPKGSRGQAAKDLIRLGPKVAVPAAVKLLKSEDYTTRYYALAIFDALKVPGVAEDIFEALKTEPEPRNRSKGLDVVQRLNQGGRIEYVPRVIPFLDDPAAEVRNTTCVVIQTLAGIYEPTDRTPEWWKEWWQKNKPDIEKRCLEKNAAKAPEQSAPKN